MKTHSYALRIEWTGNDGEGTKSYRGYRRDHVIHSGGKPSVPASSDPAFRGDAARYNPEELLVAAVSSCHMLWYLHLCAVNHICVTAYEDPAEGVMAEEPSGAGQFVRITLRPQVTITPDSDAAVATALHAEAHLHCFIARSVNFPVVVESAVKASAVAAP